MSELEEPDAHAQPRHDLPDALLQHQGRRADGAGDSAGRRGLDHRHDHGLLAGAPSRTSAGRCGQGQGRQIPRSCRPDYNDEVPDGYICTCRPIHYRATRCCARSSRAAATADIAKAVAYGKRIKLYPLSQAANPPKRRSSMPSTSCSMRRIPYDVRFFESLDRMVQIEPWLERDRGDDRHAASRSGSRRGSRSIPTSKRPRVRCRWR